MKLLFLYIKTTVKIKLGRVLEKLSQPQSRWEQASLDDCDNDCCAFTQLLQIQKNQSIKLEEHLEQNWNLLPVIGFNSTKSDLKLIELFYLPILINERDFQPTVNKKTNLFISFGNHDSQLLDILNFRGGATTLYCFLKAYKASKRKGLFPYEYFDHLDNMQKTKLPHMTPFIVNFVAAKLSKPNTRTMVTCWRKDSQYNKLLSKWNFKADHLEGLRTISTWNKDGSRNKWALSNTFCAGMTKKCFS